MVELVVVEVQVGGKVVQLVVVDGLLPYLVPSVLLSCVFNLLQKVPEWP